jgi:hypothetical protein
MIADSSIGSGTLRQAWALLDTTMSDMEEAHSSVIDSSAKISSATIGNIIA